MLNLAENLGARLELEKSAIDRNFFLMSHVSLVNFKPIFIPSYVIYEQNDHRVRIACTNRMVGNNLH